jgi:hypothetical protein
MARDDARLQTIMHGDPDSIMPVVSFLLRGCLPAMELTVQQQQGAGSAAERRPAGAGGSEHAGGDAAPGQLSSRLRRALGAFQLACHTLCHANMQPMMQRFAQQEEGPILACCVVRVLRTLPAEPPAGWDGHSLRQAQLAGMRAAQQWQRQCWQQR